MPPRGSTPSSSTPAPPSTWCSHCRHGPSGSCCWSSGTLALALGVVALVVPLIPSTPFLLIAAACYARASERLYRWLIAQPAIGRIILEWQASRTIAPDVRRTAMLTVVLSFGLSIVIIDSFVVRAVLLAIGVLVLWILSRIPTSPPAS